MVSVCYRPRLQVAPEFHWHGADVRPRETACLLARASFSL
jgi:hypothetical protein